MNGTKFYRIVQILSQQWFADRFTWALTFMIFFSLLLSNFKDQTYDPHQPSSRFFFSELAYVTCKQYADFVKNELYEGIRCGSLPLLVGLGECDPPYIIMLLTVEPSNPRL